MVAKDRAGLEADDRLAATPHGRPEGVPRGDERVEAIAGNTAHRPGATAARRRRPRQDVGWIVERHADEPAVVDVAIAGVAAVGHIDVAAHDRQRAPLVLRV